MSNQNEQRAAEESAVAQIDRLIESRLNERDRDFQAKVEELAAPREDRRIPVTNEDDGAEVAPNVDARDMVRPQGQVRVDVATASFYRRFANTPEEKVRSPEGDHFIREWCIGLVRKDTARMRRADEHLHELARAIWTVGTTGTPPNTYTGDAGPAIPLLLENIVMINRDRAGKIAPLSTTLMLETAVTRIPRMDQATVAMAGETNTAGVIEPTMDEKLMEAQKMQGRAQISEEALNDAAFNLVSLLGTRMGMAMGSFEDVQFCQSAGTGNNVSESIKVGATITGLAAAALTYANVTSVYFGVAQPYRQNGVWYVDAAGAQALTALTDQGGYPIFSQQNARPGAIVDDSADGFIFRRPVYEVPLEASTGSGIILFRDPTTYGVGRRQGMTARASEHFAWDSDVWDFKFTQRLDALVLDEGGSSGDSGAGVQDFT